MKLAKTTGTLGLAALAVIVSPFAVADDAGWYVGANIGQSRAKIDDTRNIAQLQTLGLTTTAISDKNRNTGYKLFGGYRINKNFSLEGGYFDLGRFGFAMTTLPAGSLNGNVRLQGVNLDAVGTLPVTEQFSVFGRLGLNYAQARTSFSGTGAGVIAIPVNVNPSKNQINYKLGAGVQYDFTESLAMRAEVERYRINDAIGNKGDIDMYSLGLVYRFGVEKPAPAPAYRSLKPEPVAVAPEPVPVIPPPEPVSRKVVFSADSSADSLFDFGKSTVKPSGQQALDKFSTDLRGSDFAVIMVTGHTDRIGSHAYNMKLSTSRAEAVKAYLVESEGIPEGKIEAKGVDGAEPVTKAGECKGNKVTRALIACLAPDRRVEVEVTATRTAN
ncbi:MAG: outer membrane beta-barrel protein [Gallionella sp.]|jgi:OOP family OmpA-OmpF porin